KRFWLFLFIAIVLYLFANQTQVGWIYVISAAIIGLLAVAFLYGQRLHTVQATRYFYSDADQDPAADFNLPAFHEDDPVEVVLRIENRGLLPAFLMSGEERCPFAPPTEQDQPFFVSSLFRGQPLDLAYRVPADRRGLYSFSTVPLRSKGPFGFFAGRRLIDAPGDILIYPQFFPLKRLAPLEMMTAGQRQTRRVGAGVQVLGTREYRRGDALRQIHWRSTARRGDLVVKEFADDDQLTLTVVLDLQAGSSLGRGKFSTFETAVRLAASLSHYADSKDIPFYVAGSGQRWSPPQTSLSWWAAMNYLARVQQDGRVSMAETLNKLPALPFVVALISRPSPETARALQTLQRKGTRTLAIFITPDGDLPDQVPVTETPTLKTAVIAAEQWEEGVKTL
ncbi:MAG: DUF58 domain-containing protein, partial [Anaerolineae bacterium]|nr:DUF58 domain-containing protein [Anaerolineae bacterium]